ncbi:MAG: HEAT repeat domain-containing protein [Terriglobia bacterium]
MPFLPDRLIHGVLILSLAIFLLSLLLVVIAMARRMAREKEFRVLDELRSRLRLVFESLRDGTISDSEALRRVREMLVHRSALEQLLLEHLDAGGDAAHVRRLAEDLGLIEAWRRRLEPPGLVPLPSSAFGFWERARNADKLGRLRDAGSWSLLADALRDPSSDVQRVALRALAAIGELQSFYLLTEYARRVLAEPVPSLSARELRAALARFPLGVSGPLWPLLCDPNPKLQLLAADVLTEMLSARAATVECAALEDFEGGPRLLDAVLRALTTSESADIRARMATLLGYSGSERAERHLVRLLGDSEWFVRLRAVRAWGVLRKNSGAARFSALLTDSHWRVREAAARHLARSGDAGVNQLFETLLTKPDTYAREQIAEELDASGELGRVISRCAENGPGRDLDVLSEMLRIGRTRSVETALDGRSQPLRRAAVLARLAASSDLHVQAWASRMAPQ